MNPTVQFDLISQALSLPQHDGTISPYVKKTDNQLTVDASADVNDIMLVSAINTLQQVLEESAEVAIANANPESFSATANIARTIFMGIKMLKDGASPKKGSKIVNNHLHVDGQSCDEIIAARKLK